MQAYTNSSKALFPERAILVVDDDETIFPLVEKILRQDGITRLRSVSDSRDVEIVLSREPVEVILLDLHMPHVSGAEVLAMSVEKYPEIPVIIVTGVDDILTVVACMRGGAFDYLVKPFESTRLVASVRQAIEQRALRHEVMTLRGQLQRPDFERNDVFEHILTRNRTMIGIMGYLETVAPSPKPVLILGETGVGKDLLARAVHSLSGNTGPFVTINVGGLDDQLVADTLFGHLRGSFTGAERAREGLVERAAHGTLFLDEIGDLSLVSQAKLLRLIQQHEYYPVGADAPRRCEARIVAATCHDLQARVRAGTFRKDLYFRLQVHQVEVPPLRERLDDSPLLLEHFVTNAARELQLACPGIEPDLPARLAEYRFPGNIRELEAMVFEAVGRAGDGLLTTTSFSPLNCDGTPGDMSGPLFPSIPFHLCSELPTIKQAADQLVREALRRTNGKQTTAARMLGISQPALSKRMKSDAHRDDE